MRYGRRRRLAAAALRVILAVEDAALGMPAKRAVELRGLVRRVAASGVPMLVVENSVQIAEHAAGIGLLDAADVQAVRAAI